eukprot:Gb_06683 [translate_table: standard]
MEVLNASNVVPAISFLSWPDKGRRPHQLKTLGAIPNHPSIPHLKRSFELKKRLNKPDKLIRSIGSSCSIMISALFLDPILYCALANEEALQQESSRNIDLEPAVNAVAAFLEKNPFFAFGVSLIWFIVIPVATDLVDKSNKWITAEEAYSRLRNELDSQLIDIRPPEDIIDVGSPDLESFNKRALQLSYLGDDDEFLQKLLDEVDPAKTTLYICDKYDGNSMKVAQMLTRNGFKAAYAIRDGVEGIKGWQAIGKTLPVKTVHMSRNNGAAISQDQKVDVSASVAVNPATAENQTTKPAPVQSSFRTEEVINSASPPAPVESAVEPHCSPRPLSPYPMYPDLKPPTSPTPSRP